jgi:hypothetical protein
MTAIYNPRGQHGGEVPYSGGYQSPYGPVMQRPRPLFSPGQGNPVPNRPPMGFNPEDPRFRAAPFVMPFQGQPPIGQRQVMSQGYGNQLLGQMVTRGPYGGYGHSGGYMNGIPYSLNH